MKDYYEILEVHPKASMDIIKKAYTTLAKKYHPDTTTFDKSFAQSKMIQINEAYSVLSDSEKRSDYDRSYFSSSNTRNKESQKQNNKKHNEDPHTESYDDSIESSPAGQFAIQLCTETLLELKDSIIREKHNEKRNSEICNRIDAKLDNNLKSALHVIDNSTGYKRNIYYIVGMLYWQMASAYTWTDNRQEPLKYIELAEKYIPKDADYYDYYCKSRSAVYNNEQISQMNDKYRETQTRVWLKRIAFLLIGAIGLYLSSSGGSNSTRNKSYPTTQTQKNRQLNNKKPIAKRGVISGYDDTHPIINEGGFSTLTIDNSLNDMPVYVRVWSIDSGKPVRAFYIRQGEKFTAKNMTAGYYEVRYKELYENNVKAKASKSEVFELQEYSVGQTVHYSNMSLTLYKVRHGNTQTTAIDESEV